MYLTTEQQTEITARRGRRRRHIADYYEKKIAEAEVRAAKAMEELQLANQALRHALDMYRVYAD